MEVPLYGQIQAIERDHWWYVARRKIIFDWVLRFSKRFKQPRILDIGCGTGFNIEYLRERGLRRVIGLDLSTDALRFCRSRHLTQLVLGDATHAPFRPGSFDMVLALDLIEHVEDDVTALEGLSSLLAPGGVLVIFTPAFPSLWSYQDEVSHHFRRYTAGELRTKLMRAGLKVEKLTYANTFLFPLVWAGRQFLKLRGGAEQGQISENSMHPGWSNGILTAIFAAEVPVLRIGNLPFGVSLLTLATRPR